jgi:excisionase family DNA binding protein
MVLQKLAYGKQEAAYALDCGVTKIDELIATGQLKAVKSGKRVLITAEELKRYLRELPPAEIKAHSNSPAEKERRAIARKTAPERDTTKRKPMRKAS